jgi:hypothetical protein
MMTRSRRFGVAAFLMFGLAMAAIPARADAQYFGRNKVQYESFKFEVLATPHFDIHYYPAEKAAATELGRMAERWYARLSRLFNHQLSGRQPIILYADHPDFEQTNVVEGVLGEGTGGVTEGARRRVVMPMAATLGDTDHVLGHELVHAFQYDLLGPNIEGLPLWFIEGMAEYMSLGPRDSQTAMWLRDAAIENRLPAIKNLDDPRYFPYRFGHAFWAYIGGRFGDEAVGQILGALAPSSDAAGRPTIAEAVEIITTATGKSETEISAEWHASIYKTYGVQPSPTPKTKPTDKLLIGQRTGSGEMNVGPSLSPDGSLIAFLSARDQLSIDLFLADTTTGRIVRKLVETASDSHFDSLQFLSSAGGWDPKGQRLAIGVVRKGKPAIAIIDARNGDIVKEVEFKDLGEIFNPTWAPDGQQIAFSGQVGGLTDLFAHNLTTGETRRLTTDAYADLQPAWSPDGKRIAFVTDRFHSDLPTLAFRGFGLGLISVADGTITAIDTGTQRSINPQWSGNDTLFYLGEPDGRSNVFRVDISSGQITRVTNEVTGVAGITPLSPALSVAATASRAAITLFRNGAYEIEFIDTTLAPAPPPTGPLASSDAALLPPSPRTESTVARLIAQPSLALTPATTFTDEKVDKGLHLVGIGSSAGVGTSGSFGTYVSGGIGLQFSDTLGNHVVGIGTSINGGVRDIAVGANYLNRTNRMNWGLYGERIPQLSGTFQQGTTVVGNQVVYVERQILYRQTYTQTGAMLSYPFSRSLRGEVSTGVRHIGFTSEVIDAYYDPVTFEFLGDNKTDLASPESIRMLDIGGALVRDTSAFGATSPVLGQRLRLDITPSFGDLRMTNVTVDFRQYFMPVRPVTFAARALHVARYGATSEDTRLTPLFIGYSTLVRGYDVGTFRADECSITLDGSCPEYDRMFGSRIMVFNGEARAPIPGLWKGRLDYGPIPVEIFGFFDAGIAWSQLERPNFVSGGTREWITSVGAGARVNLFGFAIAEFNLAKPIQRPERGFMFVFNFRPGF